MKPRTKKAIWGVILGLFVFCLLLAGSLFLFMRASAPERISVLFLGAIGEGNAGGDLTDTLMFVSADGQSGKIAALSLPRDIWVAPIRAKLNSAYHYGGLDLAKETVSEILGQPVDYAVFAEADFLVKVIDVLGGVEVDVEKAFDDYRYPIAGRENDECEGDPEFKCRYEDLHFDAGPQHMGGERALGYVRSRYAEGEEGTDFARNKRQQNLLLAIKKKLLSPQMIFNPRKTARLVRAVTTGIKTDFPQEKHGDLLRLALRLRPKNLEVYQLDKDLLTNPPPSRMKYDDQWVLVPTAGDWSEIREYVKQLLSD